MKCIGSLALALLSVTSVLATGSLYPRRPPGGGHGGGDSDDMDFPPGSGPSRGGGSGGGNETSSSLRGDSRCVSTMCIAAEVNGDTVRYTLTSQRPEVGWMAIGFGRQMVRSPMVILWANSDGSITLSQRQAARQVEPDVVAAPPRVATLQNSLSVASGNNQRYVFDIPANGDTQQSLIWAFSPVQPSSSDVDARLVQHTSQGTITLDLTRTTGGGTNGGSSDDAGESVPLTGNQKTLLAHAVVATVGFLVILPIGALIPRYLRTFASGWFKFHWIIQFILGGLAVVIGVILGIVGVANSGGTHVNSTHKRLGIALLVLYIVQVSLGAFIHFVKPKNRPGRPPQNYLHAVLGIAIIALALWQVRTGYRQEWPESTGRPAANGVNIVWHVWVVLLPVAYGAGLALLPRQWRQERKARQGH
ncbi:hypothetical protein CC2G_008790 [Coprinopsis cinerea AmutBmut pab1-1]|nr:hypothetical protein CC2G_008790 [Coprinopsis cinerea AmutBmut pab1-1]